jgi:hypothetical protein
MLLAAASYRRAVRKTPPLHPSARLFGAAPRRDGLWVSVWTTPKAVVCVTVGMAPGDASTTKRSVRYGGGQAASLAAEERLTAVWESYLADRAGGPDPQCRWHVFGAQGCEPPIAAPATTEGPVAVDLARRAVRNCFVPPKH